ncbi:hypothetical protein GY45DRAFT_1315702 [Cubamyces sp. BRFM 1775]|nr:hypothetical protein GY45DRAFT_1315702 [Cubamyces sp. BRFM 1775]
MTHTSVLFQSVLLLEAQQRIRIVVPNEDRCQVKFLIVNLQAGALAPLQNDDRVFSMGCTDLLLAMCQRSSIAYRCRRPLEKRQDIARAGTFPAHARPPSLRLRMSQSNDGRY